MPSQGPLNPTSLGQLALGGTVIWANVGNVAASDDVYATVVLNNTDISQALLALGFGFSIPTTAIVAGILLEIERHGTSTFNVDSSVRIYKAGNPIGTDKAIGNSWASSDAYASYGGPTDLWGTTWTPTDINDSANFGAHVQVTSSAAAQTASIDHMRITVYYEVPSKPQSQAGLKKLNAGGMGQVDFLS